MRNTLLAGFVLVALTSHTGSAAAQEKPAGPPPSRSSSEAPRAAALPPGYVVGSGDLLSIVFWRDKEMSADVVVRPDGKISLPLLNEIDAAGLSPEQLRMQVIGAASKVVDDPDVTVIVKDIRSRNVFITGSVAKPATYPLNGDMTVLQLIAVAGGLQEYADSKNIVVIRTENGKQQYHKFNYKDVVSQKRTADNIALKPGDTVVVP